MPEKLTPAQEAGRKGHEETHAPDFFCKIGAKSRWKFAPGGYRVKDSKSKR
jgi:hypothetical protein